MVIRRIVLLFVLFALSFPVTVVALPQEEGEEDGRIIRLQALPDGDVLMTVRTGPGKRVRGPMSDTPPAPPEARAEEFERYTQLPTPIRDDGTVIPPPDVLETDPDNIVRPEAPGTAIVYRDSVLAPPSGFSSNVSEPSVGSQGNGLFTTHNWYAAISTNNGASFSYVSPYTTFPTSPAAFSAGFCCDQRVAQDASRDLIFWYLQYVKTGSFSTSTNGVRIAVAHGQADLASNTWIYYNLTPSQFGLGSGRWFDFPHMQVSANYLYFTTNVFSTTTDSFVGSLTGRISLEQLAAGGSIGINSYFTNVFGSVMAVNGAGAEGARPGRTTMYFAALYSTTSARLLVWPEAASFPTVNSVEGLSTTSLSTYVCVGPDSLDPCTRANPRMQTGWITDTELGLMWTSSQDAAAGRPYPYTKVAILNPSTLAVLSQPDIWNSSYAWLYPAVAINERGHLGGTIDALGGMLYPTIRGVIRDELSPDVTTSGWETIDVAGSTHGTAGRWGDYNGAAVHELYPTTWIGGGHTQNGGSGNSNSQPHNFWLMRERDIPRFTLTVTRAGAGTGTVSSSPVGIDCGTDCGEAFQIGASVTLTATPDPGMTFSGWSGACAGTGACVVTMDQSRSVTATFSVATYALTVSLAGAGTGSVSSSPSGIDCGSDCSETYNYNTSVTLTATPATGSVFGGWSGACAGTGSCVVTMDQSRSVTATFSVATYALTVSLAGAGTGSVSSSPAGIDCGSDCSETYNYNTSVTLTATPVMGSVFGGWGGACTGTGSCVIAMDQARSVTATFEVGSFVLTVAKVGDGAGTVSSSPAGIDCGSDCSESYVFNTLVTLTATVGERSVFSGWSGVCSGTGTCAVTMDQSRTVTATFSDIGLDFYTLEPCRVIDTRPNSTLSSGVPLIIDVAGICGVPSDAKAVSINVTAVGATSSGNLRLYPGDGSVPTTSALNFQAGVNRANNSIMLLATNGDGTLGAAAFLNGGGTVDVLVDVNGYYK